MNTPEKCPKCGQALKGGFSDVYNCDSAFEEDDDGWFLAQSYQCVAIQRDQLAERVRELEAWKESAMAVEREWDPNQLAAMLGGQPGESQRAVIQWKVPVLVERVKLIEIERDELKVKVSFNELALQKIEERVKRLEVAGDAMAMAEGCRCDDGVICRRCADRVKAWHAAKGQP